jgi:nicotinamidase-related amidase
MNILELSRSVALGEVALIVIDMQGDYCEPGYYMDKAGYDVERLRRPIPIIQKVLSAARQHSLPIIYTRQYRVAQDNKLDSDANTFPLTSLKGEPGWEIVSELKPQSKEIVLDKTTCSVFASTDINTVLQEKGIKTLLFCGNTIDVCVHSSLRSASDLGYRCITIADGCGAVGDNLYNWSLESIQVEDGVFGSVVNSAELITALK